MDWRGSTALVTGASSGIGAATARLLARQGVRVALVARREERLREVAMEVHQAGGEALVLAADLTEEAARVAVVERVRSAWGPVDILVNNAGFGWYGYADEMPWELAESMVALNVLAVVHLSFLVLPEMKGRRRGAIVTIGSIAGDVRTQGIAVYSATKAFEDVFTTVLYRELRGSGVQVGIVKPGPVSSEFFDVAERHVNGGRVPSERLAVTPELVARRVWSLLRRPRRRAYGPGWLRVAYALDMYLGWAQDLGGPVLLRRTCKARHKALQRLGISDPIDLRKLACCSRGPWPVSNFSILRRALPNSYFDSLGLPRLTVLHRALLSRTAVYGPVRTVV